jgi:transposase
MMGAKAAQEVVLCHISLEERVPQDHFLRLLSRAVDFGFVYKLAKPYYSHTGQPSVDPAVVFKMALIQYLYNVPSERRLAKEIPLNLAWLWFLQYNLAEATPNHSVLSKARSRFGREVYYQFFQRTIRLCQDAGLIQGDKVVMDATLMQADASIESMVSRSLYQQLPGAPEEFVERLWQENPEEGVNTGQDQDTGEHLTTIRSSPEKDDQADAEEAVTDGKGPQWRQAKGAAKER